MQAYGPGAVVGMAMLFGSAAATTVARADEPSPWSDSERLGDLMYFGVYGGVSFASIQGLGHHSDEDGSISELDRLDAPPSFDAGYATIWWPYDFFGIGFDVETFGLPFEADRDRFDGCSGDGCRLERTPSYDGFGVQLGPSLRAAVPLRYIQPNVGLGLVMPLTFHFSQDPVSRLDETTWDMGPALRTIGGIQIYVARDWRIYADYRLDYRFTNINPGHPLEDEGWLRHSIVLGFSVSPDGYKEMTDGDKTLVLVAPVVLPAAAWTATAIARGFVE